jgi:hypothetical protein
MVVDLLKKIKLSRLLRVGPGSINHIGDCYLFEADKELGSVEMLI